MTINEYQIKAHSFSMYKEDLYPVLGLAEEAGEVAGKVAKHLRKVGKINWDAPDGVIANDVKKELGDVCWFIAEIATRYGWSLEEVMQLNIDKLTDRSNRGVVIGSGDNR